MGKKKGTSMKKAIKNAVFTLLLLTLSISTAFLAYLHFFASDDQEISGEWTAALPMTERAAVSALAWLQDIEAVSVSLEEMEAYMQGLTVQVDLVLEQNGHLSGTFYGTVTQESYDICRQAAYEAFAMAFQDLTAEKIGRASCRERVCTDV